MLIAGDVSPAHDHYYLFQKEWTENEFVEWINELPYANPWSKVILVPGNHDFFLERATREEYLALERACGGRLKILRHDIYDFEFPVSDGIDSLKIFGTPYCSIFGRWAFMVNDETLDRKFSQIPEGIDVLVSHDSPTTNKLGAITEGPWKDETTGNKILAEHIERIKPKLFVSGHFHTGNHVFEKIGETWMANVSYVDESYYPNFGPIYIPYDEETRTFFPE